MEPSISVKHTYETRDVRRVAKFIRDQSFIYRNDVWLTSTSVFVLFILVIVSMANDVSTLRIIGTVAFSAIPAIVAGIAVFVMHKVFNPWLMRRTITRNFDASPSAGIETQFTFACDGVKAESELSSSHTKWPAIVKVRETDTDILFYYGNSVGWFLPKSVFDSIGDLDSLKLLLRQSIADTHLKLML